MMINLRATLTSTSLAALVLILGTTSVAEAKRTCNPAHSKTVVGNNFARVYGKSGKAYACQDRTARRGCSREPSRRVIGRTSRRFATTSRSAARRCAWTRKNPNDVDVIGPRLTVMSIPSGSINHKLYPTARRDGEIYKIVLLSDGAVAWAESISDGGAGAFAVAVFGTDIKHHPVDRLDSCGGGVLAQVSCYITASLLRLTSGKTVEWNYSPDGQQPANLTASHALY